MSKRISLFLILIFIILPLSGCLYSTGETVEKVPEEIVISGYLVDALTSEPVPDVTVTLEDLTANSGPDGRWEILFDGSEIDKYVQKKISIQLNFFSSGVIRFVQIQFSKDGYFPIKKIIPISYSKELYNKSPFELESLSGSESLYNLKDASEVSWSHSKRSDKERYSYTISKLYLFPSTKKLWIDDRGVYFTLRYLDEDKKEEINLTNNIKADLVDVKALFFECFDLEKSIPKKDKFETTEQYQKRLKNFKYPEDFLNTFRCESFPIMDEYNADEGVLSIELPEDRRIVFYSDKKNEEYLATNAFGAQVKVESTKVDNYGIIAKNTKLGYKNLKICIPPEKAKEITKALTGLAIFKISPGDFPKETSSSSYKDDDLFSLPPEEYRLINRNSSINYYKRTEPTFSLPYEYESFNHLLNAELYEIWIYDELTKTVVLRLIFKNSIKGIIP